MPGRFFNATTLVFAVIVVMVVLWIGSGMIGRESPAQAERAAPPMPRIAASVSDAQEITRELVLYGDVEPVQVATVRARTDGIVEEIVPQGTAVTTGEEIARLSADDREARLARGEAQLASAQRDYDSAVQLFQRNVGPEADVQNRLAQLEAARADLRAIELEIANTILNAPVDGVVNRIIADIGAFVSVGGEVVEIVDNDPLLAVVHVQQGAISRVRSGLPAHVSFIGGEEREGTVRFVSTIADAATRTFRVEVEITNPEGNLPSGISAEVVIPIETVLAHKVSSALGRLDEQGRLGVHLVDEDDRIEFVPIGIARADADGVWVTGLPEQARIVTISQGTLSPGQLVEVEETPEGYLTRGGSAVGAEESTISGKTQRSGEAPDAAEDTDPAGEEPR